MFDDSKSAILGEWDNNLIKGYAIVILLNINFDKIKNMKIFRMKLLLIMMMINQILNSLKLDL